MAFWRTTISQVVVEKPILGSILARASDDSSHFNGIELFVDSGMAQI